MSGPGPGHGHVRVGVLWRGDAAAARDGIASNERLRPIIDALAARGARVQPIVYRDEIVDDVREQLSMLDAVLVWVDPIGKNGETRHVLDEVLRTVAASGVLVTAHPDVIEVVGTKEVLYRTRDVGWGADVHLYRSVEQLARELPTRLAAGPRVLKQHRGNGGIGVWKVDATLPSHGVVTPATTVTVHEARVRNLDVTTMPLRQFCASCASCFAGDGSMVDQPFQPRVSEGIIRSYLVGDEVVGFAVQGPGDLLERPGGPDLIMGLPSPKTMFPPDHPRFTALRTRLEQRWLPELRRVTGLDRTQLPMLWDIDFLLGARTAAGEDTYVLCEINASCITPFPPEAPAAIAAAVVRHFRPRPLA